MKDIVYDIPAVKVKVRRHTLAVLVSLCHPALVAGSPSAQGGRATSAR